MVIDLTSKYLNQYLLWDRDFDLDLRGDLDLDLERLRDDLSFDLDLLRRRLSRESDLERWLRRRDLERDLHDKYNKNKHWFKYLV